MTSIYILITGLLIPVKNKLKKKNCIIDRTFIFIFHIKTLTFYNVRLICFYLVHNCHIHYIWNLMIKIKT